MLRHLPPPVALLAGLAVLVGACGSTTPTANRQSPSAAPSTTASTPASPSTSTSPSPSTTQSPSPNPSPVPPPPAGTLGFLLPSGSPGASSAPRLSSISCSGTIGTHDAVAIAELSSGADVLRDYADVAHPRTECQLGTNANDVKLITAQHLLVTGQGGNLFVVVDLPSLARHWLQLPGQFPTLLAVSPHLDQVVYMTPDETDNSDKIHVASKAGDKVVASLYNPHGGRCGSPEDSNQGAFSPSAGDAFVLDQPFPSLNSLLVLAGAATKLSVPVPKNSSVQGGYGWASGSQPAMAVWSASSDTLYYRRGGNVMSWSAATGPVVFLNGVTWYYPTVSADGRYLAYATLRSDNTTHDVHLVDLSSPSPAPKLIGQLRNVPVFVNSTQLWYRSEAQGICGPGGNKPLVYDVTTGKEAATVLTAVYSVWPATSSSF